MKQLKLILICAVLAVAVGCGGSASKTSTPGQPLDPQGNWLFTLTDSTQATWAFAGQLYELTPPTVTAPNGMYAFRACNAGGNGNLILSSPAQVTGTADIIFNFVSDVQTVNPSAYTLTGVIAADQQHVSGTYTGTSPCGFATPSGTWTAQLIPSVNGNWSGSSQGVTVTADVTENVDQTSINMGQLTGAITIAGSPCMLSGNYALLNGSVHVAESVNINAGADANGVTVTGAFTVDPSAPNAATGNVFYTGGACDGQGFTFSMSK